MENLRAVQAALATAATLDDLLIVLNETAQKLDADDAKNLDLSALPTYSDNAPRDTSGVWSWDRNRKIVGDCSPFRIVSRDDEAG